MDFSVQSSLRSTICRTSNKTKKMTFIREADLSRDISVEMGKIRMYIHNCLKNARHIRKVSPNKLYHRKRMMVVHAQFSFLFNDKPLFKMSSQRQTKHPNAIVDGIAKTREKRTHSLISYARRFSTSNWLELLKHGNPSPRTRPRDRSVAACEKTLIYTVQG